jgi:cytochrome c
MMKRVMMKKMTQSLLFSLLLMGGPLSADSMLAMQSGCMGCHQPEAPLVGPPFKEIAAKYKGQADMVDKLAAKVKAGSKPGEGVWGSKEMPASPAPIENITKVVQWIIESH